MKEQRTTALRRLLVGDRPVLVAGAHDGLSARIVEEAGFDGIWASGFEISASHGVPDANVLLSLDDARGRAVIKDRGNASHHGRSARIRR